MDIRTCAGRPYDFLHCCYCMKARTSVMTVEGFTGAVEMRRIAQLVERLTVESDSVEHES